MTLSSSATGALLPRRTARGRRRATIDALLFVGAVAWQASAQGTIKAGPEEVAGRAQSKSVERARQLVDAAIHAQGGLAAFANLKLVRLRYMSRTNALEQSVRPEGPYFDTYADATELRRFDQPLLRVDSKQRGYAASWWAKADWADGTTFATSSTAFSRRSGQWRHGSLDAVGQADFWLALGPERALLTARDAEGLAAVGTTVLHGFAHDVVSFVYHGAHVRLFLQPATHMLVAVETVRPHPYSMFLSPWGDVKTTVEWEGWTREAGGLRYPRRWTVSVNGRPWRSVTIDSVELNPVIDAGLLEAPANVAGALEERPISEMLTFPSTEVDVAPGVHVTEGAWNVVRVETEEGDFIVEAPISNAYSAGAVAATQREGHRVRAVISTSDSWPHIGGLREYVSRGVPVIAPVLNRDQIVSLLNAPHRLLPDALSKHPRRPRLQLISGPTEMRTVAGPMRLLPIGTVSGERQMAIYWPQQRLLYTSDLLAPLGDAVWLPQYADEVADLIAREGLDVRTVFGMHYGPMSWRDLRGRAAPGG